MVRIANAHSTTVEVFAAACNRREQIVGIANKIADVPILCDPDKRTAKRYGVLRDDGSVERWIFVIHPNGKIAKVFRDVDPRTCAALINAYLNEEPPPPVNKGTLRNLDKSPPPEITFNQGTLRINGTRGEDRVRVRGMQSSDVEVITYQTNLDFFLDTNGVIQATKRNVRRIDFYGHDADDSFHNKTNIPCTAEGGSGKDVLIGGSNDDVLKGGDDGDYLYGGPGRDALYGHGGQNPDRAKDYLYGGSGEGDVVDGDKDIDTVNKAGDDYPGPQAPARMRR